MTDDTQCLLPDLCWGLTANNKIKKKKNECWSTKSVIHCGGKTIRYNHFEILWQYFWSYSLTIWPSDYSLRYLCKRSENIHPQNGQSVQFSSVTQSCPTLCDPMNRSMPGLPVHHQLPELTQTHFHRVRDAIQPSHPLSSPSPSAPNPSQHQSLFQWVSSSREVAKVLEFQL